jgi:hypothetical protein
MIARLVRSANNKTLKNDKMIGQLEILTIKVLPKKIIVVVVVVVGSSTTTTTYY